MSWYHFAEVALSATDHRAAERTFQVLTQVSDVRRSPLGGKVTSGADFYEPENYVIQAASKHDFEGFYRQELPQRRATHPLRA